ncbi:hypothetical protein G195_003207 [Phytophthora kernoviae 00238/432]|uniref:Carbonic anhydrase n=1 Tax=Phytophthora kernoviae 00238/432 TaxID=1284355 RepID=A0A8J4SH95_9STRA|nr:hypothetical protein G195_003207 [Phytophthora kernoviae 00238/432]
MFHRTLKSSSLLLPRVASAMPRSTPHLMARCESSMALPTSLERLFENNKKWREGKKLLDPDYFDKTSQGQHPQYLWIGCSDSRVPAEEITGLAPGEMFVHRNVANLVVSNDISSLSVVQYAVEHLKVKDIIVCGHYGCGGVHAAVENKDLGLLDNWLRNIRDVCRLHKDELEEISDQTARMRRTVELNTIEQCINVFKIGLVQRHQAKYGFPRIHGLVYDLKNGQLNEMDIDFQSYVKKYNSIYKLHSFPEGAVPLRRSQLQGNMIRTLTEGHDEEPNRVSAKYIKRAMSKEPILFSETEINSAVARAQEGELNSSTSAVRHNEVKCQDQDSRYDRPIMFHRALKTSSLLLHRKTLTRSVSSMALPTSLERLFENNKKWREGKKLLDPDYFDKTSQGQHPQYLWIGCSDSRVPAEEITGLAPGEMFVHRNVANLVVSNDISSLSVVQYAVEHLKVKDIIVCGHYGCGGVHAAVENKDLGLLDNWLRNIRDVCRLHKDELEEISDQTARMRRTVELNTIEQCINVFKIGLVQRHQVKYGFPRIHGLVYDLKNGQLNEMDIDFRSYVRKYRSIYKLHSFPSEEPLRRSQLQGNMIRTLTEGHDEEPNRVSTKFIKRAMSKEPILFSETEINSAIARAQEGETDNSMVNIEKLARYFDH